MDPYTSELFLLERREAVAREAELRSRLFPSSDRSAGFTAWVAGCLRGVADRLDGRTTFESAAQ